MNSSEKLYSLFDRSLEPYEEENLFLELATNENLRTQFRQLIDIETTVRYDSEAFQPHPDSQSKIFSSLGISMAEVSGVSAGTAAAGSFAFGKYFNYALLSLSSLVIGGILSFLIFGKGFNENSDNLSKNSSAVKTNNSSMNSNPVKNIPVTESYSTDTVYKDRIIVKYVPGPERIIYVNNQPDELVQSEAAEIEPAQIRYAYRAKNNTEFALKNHFKQNTENLNNSDNPYSSNFIQNLSCFEGSNFALEVKFNEDWSIPGAEVPRSSYPVFNNTSATLLYNLSEDLKIGADIRQEYFYLKYSGFKSKDIAYDYFQHTNYISVGLMARYALYNSNSAKMFIQPEISLNEVGPVYRTMLGGEYNFTDRVSFILGVEGSLLQFSHQGNTFYSPKIGFHYGIRFNP